MYTASASRELDRQAQAIDALADGELMQRAGESAYRLLRYRWPRAKSVLILCGPGNNGGDGYVLARLCLERGLQPQVLYTGELERQSGDARVARQRYQEAGGPLQACDSGSLPTNDMIVDAVLGSGSDRELSGTYLQLVKAINASPAPVLALDLPSGIDADSGAVLGDAVHAEATLCFIALKQGLLAGPALNYTGELFLDELDVSASVYLTVAPSAFRIEQKKVRQLLPHRLPDTHKGQQGRLLIIGGNTGMSGAVYLAGEAALRSGSGLVTAVLPSLDASKPVSEMIVTVRRHRGGVADLIRSADVMLVGPGLGTDQWAREMFGAVIDQRRGRKVLIDAEALTLLAAEPATLDGAVLTPHPGEAARLLGCTVAEIQGDRFTAVKEIARQYRAICVLKGAGTLISDGEIVYACDRGHPGMAAAGAGDVLSGIIAALMGQGLLAMDAAIAGVWLHAVAGEQAASVDGNGLMAGDITRNLPGLMLRVSA